MYVSFNAVVTVFESGSTDDLDAAIVNLVLVGFLCRVQYALQNLWFISFTSRLNLFFKNDAFPDTVLWTDLVAFAYADGMLLILFRPSSMIKTWFYLSLYVCIHTYIYIYIHTRIKKPKNICVRVNIK